MIYKKALCTQLHQLKAFNDVLATGIVLVHTLTALKIEHQVCICCFEHLLA